MRLVWALSGCLLTGCQLSHEKADRFAAEFPQFDQGPAWRVALLYLPNRLVDLVDVVHVGVALGLGYGFEFQATRYARLGAYALVDAGPAWLGRYTNPFEAAVFAGASASLAEAQAGVGPRWRAPKWDVGLTKGGIYAAFAPDELVDFFAGLACFDLKGDDW